MKQIKRLGYLLTLLLFLMLPKSVLAAACVANMIDQYKVFGFSCTVGDLEFSDFSSIGTNYGGDNVLVIPQSSAGQAGFTFDVGLNSDCSYGPGMGGCNGFDRQLGFGFTVTALNGLITGNSYSMTNYHSSGNNSTLSMNGLFCSNCSSPPSLTASYTYAGINSTSGYAYLYAMAMDTGSEFGGGAYVYLNQVTMQYTVESTAVPIPAAAWLFGSGLLGLMGFARRKKV